MDIARQLLQQDLAHIALSLNAKTAKDVERALTKHTLDINDFMALISHAARPYLEDMAALSQQRTRHRFGNTMNLSLIHI